MKEPKERELNPPDITPKPTFETISTDAQNKLLNSIFINNYLEDTMVDMHENESLHDVVLCVHHAWQKMEGIKSIEDDPRDLLRDIIKAWGKALYYTLEKQANYEFETLNNNEE